MDDRVTAPALVRPAGQTGRKRSRRWWLIAGGAAVILLLLWLLHGTTATAPHHAAGSLPQPVAVAAAATGQIRVVLNGLGAVTPLATVTVKTQIDGQILQIGFTEGQLVHKGDFLVQIDPRPYQVALENAEGALARDQALLGEAETDYQRYAHLARLQSIAQQQAADQAFLVKQYQGTVITDRAAIDSAKLNLVYCHITAPVDGRVGLRQVDVGNYVQTSDTNGLVVLTQLQPMSVEFSLPEDDIPKISVAMHAGALSTLAYDRSNTTKLATGTLAALDTQVNNTTGTVQMRAMFANTDNALFPQQFVNIDLIVQVLDNVVTVPSAAVQTGAPGPYVYRLDAGNLVHVVPVKTGPVDGDNEQITDGIKAGDQVVTDGTDRLRDGAKVAVPGAPPGTAAATPPAAPPGGGHRHRHRPAPSGSDSDGSGG